jgi:hypothetical protein
VTYIYTLRNILMLNCKLIIEDEVNIKLEGLDVDIRRKLANALKFEVPYAKHMPQYKLGRWDGKVAFFGVGGTGYTTVSSSSNGQPGQSGYVEITWNDSPTPISNICFPAGTPIKTDQGIVNIDQIQTDKHTINGKVILGITKTVTLDKYLICFQASSIGRNIPNKKTVMTKDHLIEYKGQLVPAHRFLHLSKNVKKVQYLGETLYNVLLTEHSIMDVNNLKCENSKNFPFKIIIKNQWLRM